METKRYHYASDPSTAYVLYPALGGFATTDAINHAARIQNERTIIRFDSFSGYETMRDCEEDIDQWAKLKNDEVIWQ